MKLLLTLSLTLFFTYTNYGQDYLDHIAEETCDCLGDVNEYKTYDEFTMAMGLCMITEAEPYKKKLKKDFKIDFSNLEQYGEALGQQIGMRLVGVCPEFIEAFSKFDEEFIEEITGDEKDYDASESESIENSSSGIVKSYEEDGFLTIKVEDKNGAVTKLLWLEYVDSEFDLDKNLDELTGLEVNVTYVEEEYYDVRSKEYRYYKVLKTLRIND